jgi:Ca2+:H+ antiporter
MSSLMAVSSASLIIPATLWIALSNSDHRIEEDDARIMLLSRGTAIILLLLYVSYLFFQLKTHYYLFDAEDQQEEDEEEEHILSPWAASIALLAITFMVAVCAAFLVDSIDSTVETVHISKTFIGMIVIPIVGNAAKHVTACIVAYKGKSDLAISVAVGSSLQIAIFVTPFLVILGWIINQPMTLHFQLFETVMFFLSVLVVNYLIRDGKSNWLEGAMCLGM